MRERIKLIMEAMGLKSSEFADKVGVTRGAISHILGENGRKNDPSKTTIDKILKAFPNISREWFWTGEGSMYVRERFIKSTSTLEPDLFDEKIAVGSSVKSSENEYKQKVEDKTTEIKANPPIIQDINLSNNISKKIDQIIVYFSDKTFMTFISKD